MKFFYAQSSNNKIVVTAPWQTFYSVVTAQSVLGVVPYAYTDSEGRKNFKETDIKEINYYPLNNRHFRIEVIFSNSFNPKKGTTIQLKAIYNRVDDFYIFSLPYVKSSSIDVGQASTAIKTLAISREEAVESPLTVFKTYVDGEYVETQSYSSKSFSSDINKFESKNKRIEYIGATIANIDPDQVLRSFETNAGKYLTSSNFTEVYNNSSSYFYVYIENASTEFLPESTINRGGGENCFDPLASNFVVNADINKNNCVYDLREPENIVIKTTLKNNSASVYYLEKNLDSSTFTNISDFNITSLTVKGITDSTPSTKTINVEQDYSTLQVSWEDADASVALDTSFNPNPMSSVTIRENITSGGTGSVRSFSFLLFKITTIGCLDNTSLNYDSNAEEACANCCVYCDNLKTALNAIKFPPPIAKSTTNDLTDDDNTIVITNVILKDLSFEYAAYLSKSVGSFWTVNIYNSQDLVKNSNLNNGDQATLLASPILSGANFASDSSSIQRVLGPSVGSGLFPGQSYWAEYVFNNGGGCTFYRYQPFVVPFDGCLDPAATNYNPLPGNTGNGNCTYSDNITACEQTIISSVSQPVVVNNNQALTTLTISGLSSNGQLVDSFGVFTAYYSLTDNSVTPPAFLGTFSITTDAAAGPNNPFSFNIILPQNTTATVTVSEFGTSCSEILEVSHPGIVTVGGCTDPFAVNYNPNANVDDGKCIYCEEFSISGVGTNPTGDCANSSCNGTITFTVDAPGDFKITVFSNTLDAPEQLALNQTQIKNLCPGVYYATATLLIPGTQNTCTVTTLSRIVLSVDLSGCGCTNPDAVNYDPSATSDDGSCVILGCTNPLAINYNKEATEDDSSCIFSATYDPECIPNSVAITSKPESYETTLNNIKRCVAQEGTRMLFKIKGGIVCDTAEQIKLTLITYLLNRIGLECLYNCNYTFPYTPKGGELPTGTETYLETFINFVQKYCIVCAVEPQPPTINEQGESNILNFISLENGDNIRL